MYTTPYQDGVVFSFHDASIITVLCLEGRSARGAPKWTRVMPCACVVETYCKRVKEKKKTHTQHLQYSNLNSTSIISTYGGTQSTARHPIRNSSVVVGRGGGVSVERR